MKLLQIRVFISVDFIESAVPEPQDCSQCTAVALEKIIPVLPLLYQTEDSKNCEAVSVTAKLTYTYLSSKLLLLNLS